MAEKLSHLMGKFYLQIQEILCTISKTNTKKITSKHIIIKLLKIRIKEKTCRVSEKGEVHY